MEPQNKHNEENDERSINKFIRFSSIAFEMGLIIAAGAIGGHRLDQYFEFEKPILTIVLSLFSIFAALYLVIKRVNNVK